MRALDVKLAWAVGGALHSAGSGVKVPFEVYIVAASLKEDVVAAKIRFINPDGLSKPPSYSQVVEVNGSARTIYISGQLGSDHNGEIVGAPGDFLAQAVQVFENLAIGLSAVGATFDDVVKVNTYLADIDHLPILREVRARYINSAAPPASTTIAVSRFARAGALLEVEAIATLSIRSATARGSKPRGAGPRRQVKTAKRKRR
jgi:2-iminobutanoate/2-iminopropanoate deaminase